MSLKPWSDACNYKRRCAITMQRYMYTDRNSTMTAARNVWKLLFWCIAVESLRAILPNTFRQHTTAQHSTVVSSWHYDLRRRSATPSELSRTASTINFFPSQKRYCRQTSHTKCCPTASGTFINILERGGGGALSELDFWTWICQFFSYLFIRTAQKRPRYKAPQYVSGYDPPTRLLKLCLRIL